MLQAAERHADEAVLHATRIGRDSVGTGTQAGMDTVASDSTKVAARTAGAAAVVSATASPSAPPHVCAVVAHVGACVCAARCGDRGHAVLARPPLRRLPGPLQKQRRRSRLLQVALEEEQGQGLNRFDRTEKTTD